LSVDAFCDVITDYPWEFMENVVGLVDRDLPHSEPFYDEFNPLYKLAHACSCTDDHDSYLTFVFQHFQVNSDVIVFLFLYYSDTWAKYVHLIDRCSDKNLLAKKVLAQCKNEEQIDAIFPIIEGDDTILSSTTNLNTLRLLCDNVALPRERGLMTHVRSPSILKILLKGKAYDGSFDDLKEGFIKNNLFLEAIRGNCHRTIQYLFQSMDCQQLDEPHVEAFLMAERNTQALIETIYSLTRVFKKATISNITSAILRLELHSVYLLGILARFVEEKGLDAGPLIIHAFSHVLSLAKTDEDISETLHVSLPFIDHNVMAYIAVHHPNVMKIAHEQFSLRFQCSVVMNGPIKDLFELPLDYSVCDNSLDYVQSLISTAKSKLCLEDKRRIPSLVYTHDSTKITMRPFPSTGERYNVTVYSLNRTGANPFHEKHYFHNMKVINCYSRSHTSTYTVTLELGDFDVERSHTKCNSSVILTQQGKKKPIPAIVLPRERWEHARNIEKELIKEVGGVPTQPCFDIYCASFDFKEPCYVKIMQVNLES